MFAKKYLYTVVFTSSMLVFLPASEAFQGRFMATASDTNASGIVLVNQNMEEQAKNLIQSMGDEVIDYISDPAISEAEEKAKLREVLNKNFDMDTISRFALGRHWRALNSEQQKEYKSLFEEMIVSVYADKFSHYEGQKFNVDKIQPSEGEDYSVLSYIVQEAGEDIPVTWRLREKNGQLKVVDVAIKSVSMIVTQRSDFASAIQRNGGNAAVILDYLRDKAGG